MYSCSLFGNRDCPANISKELYSVLSKLIIYHSVETFYVGNQGHFDSLARIVLCNLKKIYPHINFYVVLAYIPTSNQHNNYHLSVETIIPENIEAVPRRFAIVHRNRWMLKKSDYVVAYTSHQFGNTYKLLITAQKQGKICIQLHDSPVI